MVAALCWQVHIPVQVMDQYSAQNLQEEWQGVRGKAGGGESNGQSQE